MAPTDARDRDRCLVLRSPGALAKGLSREPEQTCAQVFATRYTSGGALKSLHEGDLRPPEWNTEQMLGLENSNRSLQRRTGQAEIGIAVATTIEPAELEFIRWATNDRGQDDLSRWQFVVTTAAGGCPCSLNSWTLTHSRAILNNSCP